MKEISGSVTAAKGFMAASAFAGIKYSRRDIALIYSESTAAIAGVFTTNRIQGAHIKLCREHLKSGKARAIVVNSGCANACVGKQGYADALEMARITAKRLDIPVTTVFPCSTGTIGIPLPMDKIRKGIDAAYNDLSSSGGGEAARAIMTTDTHPKQSAVEVTIDDKKVRIGGIAKGSGMIEPNMATMLSYITTDACISQPALKALLKEVVDCTYNKVSIDGDMSCNDTVLIMANGQAGNKMLSRKHRQWDVFVKGLMKVAKELSMMIVKDGEGATKFVTVRVNGAKNPCDARKSVRAVANSLLVKTSWFGCDPNWGRIIDAIGYSGADIKEEKTDIRFDGRLAVKNGKKAPDFKLTELEKVLRQKSFIIDIDLHLGRSSDHVFTCDCSLEYVKINSEYMT